METPRIYTKEQAAELREKIIDSEIFPTIKVVFDKYPRIQSTMLVIAQYWDDEANDAVHYEIIFSILPTPVFGKEFGEIEDYYDCDLVNLPELPSLAAIYDSIEDFCVFESGEYGWENNGNAVSTFAAYCKEGCHQDMDISEAYTPYAVFRRKDGEIETEVVGKMLRPWLDGMRPY